MNEFATVWEDFELPSKGLVYEKPINPKVSLRSMTTMEEMKRLSPTDTPYKVTSDLIESCMKEKPDIHVFEMCIGDYQFLLHKLRTVTYGPDYRMTFICPDCGEQNEVVANLETLKVNEYTDDISKDMLITLPVSGNLIELKFQTPRDLDLIAYRDREMRKKTKVPMDYSLLFTLMSLIRKVDGVKLNDENLEEYVKSMSAKDAVYILNKSKELNSKIGLDNKLSVKCLHCGYELDTTFRQTSEFFRPTIY